MTCNHCTIFLKQCHTCKDFFSFGSFHRDKSRKDGLHYICKSCILRKSKNYYERNKITVNIRTSNWAKDNSEKRNLYSKKWRANNPDEAREAVIAWALSHPVEKKLAVKRWMDAHPEKMQEYNANSRARRNGSCKTDRPLTAQEWLFLKELYGYRCVYCGRKMKRLTQDHITPVSLGGKHTIENVVPACQSCNSRKGNRAPLIPVQPALALRFL